jgi:hypothetical protein
MLLLAFKYLVRFLLVTQSIHLFTSDLIEVSNPFSPPFDAGCWWSWRWSSCWRRTGRCATREEVDLSRSSLSLLSKNSCASLVCCVRAICFPLWCILTWCCTVVSYMHMRLCRLRLSLEWIISPLCLPSYCELHAAIIACVYGSDGAVQFSHRHSLAHQWLYRCTIPFDADSS